MLLLLKTTKVMATKTITLATTLQDKVDQRIQAGKARAAIALKQIQDDSASLTDHFGFLGKQGNFNFHSNGVFSTNVDGNKFDINEHAIAQAGTKLGVPTRYIKDLAHGQKWERDLAANILNEHSQYSDRNKVLVRSVNGQIRGLLSENYRRLNTSGIYAQFLDATNSQGAIVVDAHLNEQKSYLETLIPQMFEIVTPNNGIVHVLFGARISNSDFGAGSLEVRTFMLQAVCTNGMVRDTALKQVHRGSKIDDMLLASQRTVDLDTQAQASFVNDMVTDLLSAASIKKQINSIQETSAKTIDLDKELKLLPKAGMMKGEVDLVGRMLMENNPNDGVQGIGTAWKMSQAITALARDTKNESRRRDLEEIGGTFLTKIK